jgi:hypothetical protein
LYLPVSLDIDFNAAIRAYDSLMSGFARASSYQRSIPDLQYQRWQDTQEQIERLNCLSFGVDAPISNHTLPGESPIIERLMPGELSIRKVYRDLPELLAFRLALLAHANSELHRLDLKEYGQVISTRLNRDGMEPLGDKFAFSDHGYPIAVFLGKFSERRSAPRNNFHVYTWRKDPDGFVSCAYKGPGIPVQTMGTENLFVHALKHDLDHFCGYFMRPDTLDY